MSIYSNVAKQNLVNLRKLAEQQQNQRTPEIKNRILRQTYDIKLAKSLAPITKKFDEVKVTTQKIREIIEKSQAKNIIPRPAFEHTPHHQPLENKEGVVYDTEIQNTLKNMKINTGFFQTFEDPENGWMWNEYPVKISCGTEVEIKYKNFYSYRYSKNIN